MEGQSTLADEKGCGNKQSKPSTQRKIDRSVNTLRKKTKKLPKRHDVRACVRFLKDIDTCVPRKTQPDTKP